MEKYLKYLEDFKSLKISADENEDILSEQNINEYLIALENNKELT